MPPAAKKAAGKKAAKPAAKKAAKKVPSAAAKKVARPVKKAARPTMSEVEHQNAVDRAEHAHQDPRGTPSSIHAAGNKVQPQNYGEAKSRGVKRLDVVKNWFRRGEGR
jgi:hypothetical protein